MTTPADPAGQALRRIRSQQAHVELSTAVQQSTLPTLPEHLPGLEVAVRYQPSRDGLDIGGDWYDASFLPDGAVALEIGDAQGHDVDAAVFTGRVRSSMRAIAAHEPPPGTVLTRTGHGHRRRGREVLLGKRVQGHTVRCGHRADLLRGLDTSKISRWPFVHAGTNPDAGANARIRSHPLHHFQGRNLARSYYLEWQKRCPAGTVGYTGWPSEPRTFTEESSDARTQYRAAQPA